MKGDVALEARRGTGPGDGGLIRGGVTGVDGGRTGCPWGCFSPATDGPGPALLGGQGLVVPGRALLGVGPHRWPRARVSVRVPHRLMTPADVALVPGAPFLG